MKESCNQWNFQVIFGSKEIPYSRQLRLQQLPIVLLEVHKCIVFKFKQFRIIQETSHGIRCPGHIVAKQVYQRYSKCLQEWPSSWVNPSLSLSLALGGCPFQASSSCFRLTISQTQAGLNWLPSGPSNAAAWPICSWIWGRTAIASAAAPEGHVFANRSTWSVILTPSSAQHIDHNLHGSASWDVNFWQANALTPWRYIWSGNYASIIMLRECQGLI